LRAGVNFINVLRAAFTGADLKSVKKTVKLSVFFALSGSARSKAAHRSLMKLTPDREGVEEHVTSLKESLCEFIERYGSNSYKNFGL